MADEKDFLSEDHYEKGELVRVRLTGKRASVIGELSPEPDELSFGRKYLIEFEDGVRKRIFASQLDPEE
jgi:hypothetical protein